MTVSEVSKYIGQEGTVNIFSPGLLINVKVVDVKVVYGATRLKVVPLSGKGSVWVDITRFKNGIMVDVTKI